MHCPETIHGDSDIVVKSRPVVGFNLQRSNKGDHQAPTIEACFNHLILLEAFVILRDRVIEWARLCHADPDATWEEFVRVAALRFNLWFGSVSSAVMRTSLPPIDIMMVWHSFMLNPCHYSDFCKATRPDGAGVHGIPWSLVNETIADDAGACILPQSKDNHTDLLYLDASLLTIIEANGQSGIKTLQPMAAKYPHEDTGSSPLGLSVPLPLDLAAAVHRQMIFTLKMARFGWIHSPNTNSILQRAVARYRNFFSLFSIAAGDHQVVPTVDIDLVWHTHQLSPACYALFSTTATKGRFINHVDSIEEGLIRSGFERTEMLYQNIFGEEYSICSSWFCEAMRLKREGLFADDDGLMALQTLIAQFNQRSLQLGLSTVLDLAECRCYERGVSGPPRVVENKGLSCGDCATNCSGS